MALESVPGVAVRDAVLADAAVLADMQVVMAKETEDRALDRDRVTRGISRVMEDGDKGRYLVAVDVARDKVIGMVGVTYEWSDWRCASFYWLQSVYVTPEWRRKGVFRLLYRSLEARAREAGSCGLRLYVERDNELAKKVYGSMGMVSTAYDLYEDDWVMETH